MDLEKYYLLIWDIRKRNDINSYGHYKEIKQFNDKEEANQYFGKKLNKINNGQKFISNGGGITNLKELII